MRILGIDPSNTQHAWAMVDGTDVLGFGRDFNGCTVWAADGAWKAAEVIAIEMIASYGMAVGAHTFDTCVEIGILMQRFSAIHMSVKRLTRVEVKRIVCRSVKASDANVRAAVIDYFGGPAALKKGGKLHGASKDVWAALAVAIAAGSGECNWYTPVADKELLS